MLAIVLFCCASLFACAREEVPKGELTFKRAGSVLRVVSLRELAEQSAPREVRTADPYYQGPKRFRALSVREILPFVYGEPLETLQKRAFLLTALDGYAVPIDGERLLDAAAYVAVDDLDVPGFAPIGPRKVSPAPTYLIWEGQNLVNLETHPRPWQLVAIDQVDARALYPHALPQGEPEGGAAMRGYELFRERCIRCHAINREGGKVGPELNVPQSIVSYRPEAQIRAYIKDPLTFRYGAMPANPDLTDADFDALLAYFRAMAKRQHDPEGKIAHE